MLNIFGLSVSFSIVVFLAMAVCCFGLTWIWHESVSFFLLLVSGSVLYTCMAVYATFQYWQYFGISVCRVFPCK